MFPSEARFTDYLKSQNKSWVYQPERFKLKNTTYRADFYCPEDDTYYEVVGTRQAISALKWKIQEFIEAYPNIKFRIVKPNGKNYYDKKTKEKKTELKKKVIFSIGRNVCRYCTENCNQTKYATVLYCPELNLKKNWEL